MKKVVLIFLIGLFWCNTSFAGCIKGDCNNGYGTFTGDGNKYVGEFKDGKFHGQGTLIWADGDKYVGEFKDGKGNGQGTTTYTNGNKYVGEFKDGKFHGQGTYTEASGKIYNGKWKKNKLVKTKKLTREDRNIAKAQNVCRKIGFTPGTDKFADCTLKMLTQGQGQGQGQGQTIIVGPPRKYPKVACDAMGGLVC